jgi:RNA polymerase sigma factor (sigma-70 family)
METVVNSLLEEHFQFFDRCIREVLRCHGIAYEPESAYYNDVFFRVYEHVFSPATLKKFDPAGRSFRAWLAAVARNAVLDWIKSSHPSFPIKRGAEAQSETIRAGRTLSLDAPADEDSLPLAQRVAAPESPDDTEWDEAEERVERTLAAMSEIHRAAFELLALGIRPVSHATRRWLGGQNALSPEQVEREIASLARDLEGSGAAESSDIETHLAVCQEMEQSFGQRADRAKSRLRQCKPGLRETDIESLEKEAEQVKMTFEALDAKKKSLDPSDEAGRTAIEFQQMHKRRKEWQKRKADLLEAYHRLARIRFPSYRDMGRLVGKSESAMAGLINRAKKNFLKHFETQKDRL